VTKRHLINGKRLGHATIYEVLCWTRAVYIRVSSLDTVTLDRFINIEAVEIIPGRWTSCSASPRESQPM
jgi:hypothetical protein